MGLQSNLRDKFVHKDELIKSQKYVKLKKNNRLKNCDQTREYSKPSLVGFRRADLLAEERTKWFRDTAVLLKMHN